MIIMNTIDAAATICPKKKDKVITLRMDKTLDIVESYAKGKGLSVMHIDTL
jgi:hypothetical protein